MITRGMLIESLLNAGVIKKSGRISPKVQEIFASRIFLLQQLVTFTNFLRYDASIHERLHCLIQNITEQPRCSCGNVLRMRTTGRYANTFATHCSNACTSKDKMVIQKRKDTNFVKYGAVTPLQRH